MYRGSRRRGASRREDLLDTSIALLKKKRDNDDDEVPHDGAEFLVKFVKTRGKMPVPDEFLLQLEETPEGYAEWVKDWSTPISAKEKTLRCIALRHPRTQNELADMRDLSKGAISQHCTDLRKSGLLGEGLAITDAGKARLVKFWPELSESLAQQGTLPI